MTLLTDLEPLSAFIAEAGSDKMPLESAVISDHVKKFIDELHAMQTEQYCIPIQESVVLLETAQRMWNGMALHSWNAELSSLRAQLKYIATYLYLLGNNYFAPVKVKSQYFIHHFIESEKCIVMCLKTAKSLSQNKENQLASQVLSYASSIMELFEPPIYANSKLGALRLETCFAQLSLAWDAADTEGVIRVASQLESLVAQSLSYKEALLQFVFSAAEDMPRGGESALRALLDMSLRIQQQSRNDMSAKEQSFFGVTLLQMANVLLQSGEPSTALTYAEESAQSLDSLEPLITQIKAHLMLHHTEVAGALFAKVASNQSLTFEEVLGLSTVLIEMELGILTYIMDPCRRRVRLALEAASSLPTTVSQTREVQSPEGTTHPVFQYASFLLHIKTEETILELLECLEQYPCEDLYGRFFLLSLWSVSYEGNITVETQIRALYLAFQFKPFMSGEEMEGLLTSLTTLVFKHFSTHRDSQMLLRCLDQFHAMKSDALGFYALVSRCRLSLILEAEADAVALVRLLCHRFGVNEAMPSTCGQLLHFLLKEEKKELAGTVAQLFVEGQVQFDDKEKLEVLHVCALASLPHLQEKSTLAQYVCALVVPVLEVQTADSSVDMAWWCRFLWQVGDSLTDSDPRAAVHITLQGILIFKNSAQTPSDRDLLLNRILYAVRSEFLLFLTNEPHMSVQSLSQLLSLAPEVGSVANSADPFALVLASLEVSLRESNSEFHAPQTIESLANQKAKPADLERVAAACLKTSMKSSSFAWQDYAAKVQMLAIEKCEEECVATGGNMTSFSHVMAMYYKGYHMMGSDEQKRDLLLACHRFTCRLGNNESISSFVEKDDEMNKEKATFLSQQVEQILEFFSVESWNTAVKKNAMHQSAEVSTWMKLSLDLSHLLSDENVTKHTITDFAALMPLMAD